MIQELRGLKGKPARRLDCPACGKTWHSIAKRYIVEEEGYWNVRLSFTCKCGCEYDINIIQDYEAGAAAIEYHKVVIKHGGEEIDYHEYITSPEWRAKADAAKERAGHRCQLCNSGDQLDAHHRTYERLGNEEPEDITVLCRDCHAKFHGKNGESDG